METAHPPLSTFNDVHREVDLLLAPVSGKKPDEAYGKYRTHLQEAEASLKRASDLLADGKLENFLACSLDPEDKNNRRRRKALCQIVLKLGVQLSDHLRKLTFDEPEPEFADDGS